MGTAPNRLSRWNVLKHIGDREMLARRFGTGIGPLMGRPEAIAILLPHDNVKHKNAEYRDYLTQHITTIQQIETVTGVRFFPKLAAPEQTALETAKAPALWPVK